jgi:hypothetical protein
MNNIGREGQRRIGTNNNSYRSVPRASVHWKEETGDVIVVVVVVVVVVGVTFVVVLEVTCTIVCQGSGHCESLVCP